MLRGSSSLFTLFTRIPLLSISPFSYHSCLSLGANKPIRGILQIHRFSMDKRSHLCSLVATSACEKSHIHHNSSSTPSVSRKSQKKARFDAPENVLKFKLDMCSKRGDLVEALRLYDEARANGVKLNHQHYNSLLYLCSSSSVTQVSKDLGLQRGFEIFEQMSIDKVAPNEATFTNLARLAVAMEDPEKAFALVKQMKTSGIPPRLRSYGPALLGFCGKGMPERAYEVDEHMAESGVIPEEPELSSLLKVSVDASNPDKVYEILHRLRASVRQVSETTLGIIEDWFGSECATRTGKGNWDESQIREGVKRGGGGWHGQGWLGTGQWSVVRTQMNDKGVCHSCGEKLVCIDIDPGETEKFASSLANLACEREVKANFIKFQEWLQKNGPFDAVIDGANVGLIKQYDFNFYQLMKVVNQIRETSPSKKLPLIILHNSRITRGPAQHRNNKTLIDFWNKSGALYAAPHGSNDDWYWLYAAVSCKCLLVTNDEMRDHLFQLLGTSFFPQWKEKHQVRLSVSRDGPKLCMPPPYSIVIQESENGSWHVPTMTEDDLENPRQWLCATRPRN